MEDHRQICGLSKASDILIPHFTWEKTYHTYAKKQ